MKKHDTIRKENAKRETTGSQRKLRGGLGLVAVIGSVERLRNPEFWK